MKIFTLNGEAQGFASFSRREQKIWEWGFYLAPDCPRGQGREFAAAMLHYAFAELGASTVRGRVLPHNAPSLALHQKMGFRALTQSDGEAQLFELLANEFAY